VSSRPVARIATVVTLAALAGIGTGAQAAAAAPARSSVAFQLSDPRIDEASGIAAGIASPGVVYVQNDSGDAARFFALDRSTGRTLATYTVPDATNVDWEDIAVARDAKGTPSVWLGDIGDNGASRTEVDIYRVDEPQVDMTGSDVAANTSTPQVWRLRYPSGPADAESLAVAPGGAAYVITKSPTGVSQVFAVPARPDPSRIQMLRAIGSLRFGFTGTPGGPSQFGQLTATGAALSRDGSMLAVRTYTDAYLWRVRAGSVVAAITAAPVRVALPAQPQGEGIGFDGARLLIDSEGVGSAVYAVAVPVITPAAQSPSPSPVTPPGAAGSGGSGAVDPSSSGSGHRSSGAVQLGAGVLVVAMVVLTAYLMRRRRRGR
jgi:hypothetical protein